LTFGAHSIFFYAVYTNNELTTLIDVWLLDQCFAITTTKSFLYVHHPLLGFHYLRIINIRIRF